MPPRRKNKKQKTSHHTPPIITKSTRSTTTSSSSKIGWRTRRLISKLEEIDKPTATLGWIEEIISDCTSLILSDFVVVDNSQGDDDDNTNGLDIVLSQQRKRSSSSSAATAAVALVTTKSTSTMTLQTSRDIDWVYMIEEKSLVRTLINCLKIWNPSIAYYRNIIVCLFYLADCTKGATKDILTNGGFQLCLDIVSTRQAPAANDSTIIEVQCFTMALVMKLMNNMDIVGIDHRKKYQMIQPIHEFVQSCLQQQTQRWGMS